LRGEGLRGEGLVFTAEHAEIAEVAYGFLDIVYLCVLGGLCGDSYPPSILSNTSDGIIR